MNNVNENEIKNHRRRTGRSLGLTMLCLGLSLLFCTGGAVAWLSRNRYTESQDMEVHAATTPNLVIALPSNGLTQPIQNEKILTQAQSPFTVSFLANAIGLTAATHDNDYASGLKYFYNTEDLDRITGLPLAGKTPDYRNATKNIHYLEYTVHIAAAGGQLENVDLVAEIESPTAGSNDTINALSVDFLVSTTKSAGANPIGTLNVAGRNSDNSGSAQTSLNILSNGTIKVNTEDYITVTMRVYFDGGLLKEAGKTYLTAANLDTNDISLNIKFSAINNHVG